MRKRSIQRSIHVPEEIIEEVLYKLPPKALLRFKSVCKSWRSKISSPDFIEKHLNNKSSNFAHQNLILSYGKDPVLCLKSASLQSILDCAPNDVVGTTTILDYSRMDPRHGCLQIYGSCNGLVLLTTEDQRSVLLWNPLTRKARKLLPLNGQRSFISSKTVYGFGYINHDYKIVCIYPWSERWFERGRYETQIYSLRNDSWKELEDFYEGCTPVADSGKFVNGRPHWIATKYDKDGAYIWNIVCLDLRAEERYEMVPKPDCLLSESCCYPHCLRVFGGTLGLVCSMNERSNISVWVMKEYGVRESWVNILNISSLCERYRDPWGRRFLSPFRLGDSVLIFGSSLIFYDGQNNLRDIQTDVVRDSAEAYVYVESLVSPFADGEEPPNIATNLLSSWLGLDRPSSVSVPPSYEFRYEWPIN